MDPQVGQSLDAFPSVSAPLFLSKFPPMSILFPLLRSTEASTLWFSHMLHYVHSSHIYSSQTLERTQMSLNREMDTENVEHLHNGVLLSY